MRLIIVFAIAALAVAGLLPRYVDRIAGHAAPPPAVNAVQTVAPPPAYSGGPRTVVIQRDAARLGYHPAMRDYVGQVQTANGLVRVARVKLDMVEVGGVMVRDVDAVVSPDEGLRENLLGLSFLSRLRRFEYREGRLVLEE